MKGRPLSTEELDQMIEAIPKGLARINKPDPKYKRHNKPRPKPQIPPATIESWQRYLQRLWWSGLRLR
jgi:hypothetical protein